MYQHLTIEAHKEAANFIDNLLSSIVLNTAPIDQDTKRLISHLSSWRDDLTQMIFPDLSNTTKEALMSRASVLKGAAILLDPTPSDLSKLGYSRNQTNRMLNLIHERIKNLGLSEEAHKISTNLSDTATLIEEKAKEVPSFADLYPLRDIGR